MNKVARLLALGFFVVFFILITSSDLGSLEQGKSKARLTRLTVLDEGDVLDQGYDQNYYPAGKKGYLVVYSVMVGYTDSNDTEFFPYFTMSLKEIKKFLIRVDFMCTTTASFEIYAVLNGIDSVWMLWEDKVNAKKNVYYRAEFEIDKGDIALGVYDLIAYMKAQDKSTRNISNGGQTSATARVKIYK